MTDLDILALRARVAVKLKLWERCPRCNGTLEVQGKLCQHPSPHNKVPTLAELCEPMLEWMCKHTISFMFDPYAKSAGCDIRVEPERGREFGVEHKDSPALALAMAVDALGEVEA